MDSYSRSKVREVGREVDDRQVVSAIFENERGG